MSEIPSLFIVAGEPSGDRLGADLVRRLRVDTPLRPIGVGGPELSGEGLTSIFPMRDLSVMGTADVLARLPLLLWRLRQTVEAIIAAQPDVVLLIDSQVFSQTVATRLRKRSYQGKVLLYVAPSVWAWKPERAPALRPLFDEVLAVLPFEPAAMQALGGPRTTYVGHPALEQSSGRAAQPERGPLLLLPGSRRGELRRHLPLMRAVAAALQGHPKITGLVLPTVRDELARVSQAVSRWPFPVTVTAGAEAKHRAFVEAVAAVAVTGTVTLELALASVPMVTTYIADRSQAAAAEKYKLRFAALPNILLGEPLVPELTGTRVDTKSLIAATRALLDEPRQIEDQRAGFTRIREAMRQGLPDAPMADAAEVMRGYFRLPRAT